MRDWTLCGRKRKGRTDLPYLTYRTLWVINRFPSWNNSHLPQLSAVTICSCGKMLTSRCISSQLPCNMHLRFSMSFRRLTRRPWFLCQVLLVPRHVRVAHQMNLFEGHTSVKSSICMLIDLRKIYTTWASKILVSQLYQYIDWSICREKSKSPYGEVTAGHLSATTLLASCHVRNASWQGHVLSRTTLSSKHPLSIAVYWRPLRD